MVTGSHLVSAFQTLVANVLGKVKDFTAIPGCGLKCNVTALEQILDKLDMVAVSGEQDEQKTSTVLADCMGGDTLSNQPALPVFTVSGEQDEQKTSTVLADCMGGDTLSNQPALPVFTADGVAGRFLIMLIFSRAHRLCHYWNVRKLCLSHVSSYLTLKNLHSKFTSVFLSWSQIQATLLD